MNKHNPAHEILRASLWAAKLHADQRRKGKTAEPYINHPLEVASLVAIVDGGQHHEAIIAALLHDVVEDTTASLDDVRERFGPAVAQIVSEVTDDKSLHWKTRKDLQIAHAAQASFGASLVKLADKTANLCGIAEDPPKDWSLERRLAYIAWSRTVVASLPKNSAALEALFHAAATEAETKIRQVA